MVIIYTPVQWSFSCWCHHK